jgi:phosphoenolpyruvate synthase/pyruvate phosphate dikinase
MSYTRALDQIGIRDIESAGEKAAHLGELISAGFDVPSGVCVTSDGYHAVLDVNQLGARISERIASTEIDDPIDLEQTAEDIRTWIEQADMPEQLVVDIRNALAGDQAAGDSSAYAVRVSRVMQDVVNPRASGLPQAYLGVANVEAVLEHIRKCWATPWTSRAIYYRTRRRMEQNQIAVAVVVQPMMPADVAGVMFTANPATLVPTEIHIDATWGLGEALNAARWAPDHWVVDKRDLSIRDTRLASKSVMEIAGRSGGLETVAVSSDRQEVACLSNEQIAALAQIGIDVERHLKQPQDLEWCRVGDRFFLLQTRPLKT